MNNFLGERNLLRLESATIYFCSGLEGLRCLCRTFGYFIQVWTGGQHGSFKVHTNPNLYSLLVKGNNNTRLEQNEKCIERKQKYISVIEMSKLLVQCVPLTTSLITTRTRL